MKALLAFLLCVTAVGLAQAQPSRFSRETYIEKGDTLSYRMLFPDANRQRKYPLVIFLHGSGERGSDNDAQLKWGVMNFATDQNMIAHPAIVIAPQCPEHQAWSSVTPDKNRKGMTLNADASAHRPYPQVGHDDAGGYQPDIHHRVVDGRLRDL
jgi:poly(3-hydroxybutyrate) depolymerase